MKRSVIRKKREGVFPRGWKPARFLAENLCGSARAEGGQSSYGKKRVTWDLNLAVKIEEKDPVPVSFGLEEEERKKKQKKTKFYRGFWSKKLGLSDNEEDQLRKTGNLKVKEDNKSLCCCCKCVVVLNKPPVYQ